MSKFAFSCRPATFVPYDSRARGALRDFGHDIPDHGYALYMQAFIAEKAKTIKRLHALGITPSKLPYRGAIMEDALFEMRVVDKRLMLKGGFSPESMARTFGPTDFRLVHKRRGPRGNFQIRGRFRAVNSENALFDPQFSPRMEGVRSWRTA
jgi:hypothetical protein